MNFVFDDMTIKLEKTFVAISGRGYHKPQAEAMISGVSENLKFHTEIRIV